MLMGEFFVLAAGKELGVLGALRAHQKVVLTRSPWRIAFAASRDA
jgi:hypothetical protein